MKKMYLFAAVVIAAVAGTVCYNHERDNELSDLAKKNVKALALDGIELGPLCIYERALICHIFKDENPPLEIPGIRADL